MSEDMDIGQGHESLTLTNSLFFICSCFLFFCLFSHLTFYVPVISDDERGSGGERYWLVVCLCTRCKRILRGDKFDDYLVRK